MSAGRRERACLVALASLPGIGPATLLACLGGDGAEAAWSRLVRGDVTSVPALASAVSRLTGDGAAHLARAAQALDPDAVLDRHERAGQRVVVFGGPGYPNRLLDDPAPPALLFTSGDPSALDGPAVAIVGTRNCTRLGYDTASSLARGLAEVGVSVVSGLALGIDGAAHAPLVRDDAPGHGTESSGGPLDPAGRPIGVIATGLDRTYPRQHALLHRQVAARGLLLSETPMGGDTSRWRFPARNRIIAGVADAVVVVESRSAGGSMLTAAEALLRNVTVLAVPGHPTSPASAGPVDLICDGATPVRDVDDVLVAIGLGGRAAPVRSETVDQAVAPPDPAGAEVLDHLAAEPRSLGELMVRTGLAIEAVSSTLASLEAAGLVVRTGSWFERVAPPDRRGRTRAAP